MPERTATLNRLVERFLAALVLAAAAAPTVAAAGERPRGSARSAQVTVVEQGGFDWADAAIGALGAFGAMFVAVGLALAVGAKRKGRLS